MTRVAAQSPSQTGSLTALSCIWPGGCNGKHHARGVCQRHYQKLYRTVYRNARTVLVDPALIRQRILEHDRRGRNQRHLATAAGVDLSGLNRIHRGKTRRVKAATALKIMSVPLPPTHIGTLRRIQALGRIGYTWQIIAAEAGISYDAMRASIERNVFPSWISLPLASLFDRLFWTQGPSRRTALVAQKRGWPSTLAWSGVNIDDPDAGADTGPSEDSEPFDEAVVLRFIAGEMTGRDVGGCARKSGSTTQLRAARDEAIHRLTRAGRSAWWISKQIGCVEETVLRVRAHQQSLENEQDSDTSEGQRAS